MIVLDSNLFRLASLPVRANPPLIVDADAILSGAIATHEFESIAGRGALILQIVRIFQVQQFTAGSLLDGRRQFA